MSAKRLSGALTPFLFSLVTSRRITKRGVEIRT
jgi:hypothetical protein